MAAPQKVKAGIEKINRFQDEVTLFKLKPDKKCRFRPGQFLHLAIDDYDPSCNWPESRAFSIANSPQRSDGLDILVSPKGAFTNRMVTQLKVSDTVWIKLPFGSFNFNDAEGSDCILIAGGTGISPFISFLENVIDVKSTFSSIRLFYGVRSKDLIIFDDQLYKCSKIIKGFTCSIFIENGIENLEKNIRLGILPVSDIINSTKCSAMPIYYLSGPKAMITAFEKKLKENGTPEKMIFYDRWE